MFSDILAHARNIEVTAATLGIFGVALGSMLAIFGLSSALAGRDPVRRRLADQSVRRGLSSFEAGILRPGDANPTGLMKTFIPADRDERGQIQRRLAEAGLHGPHALRNFYFTRLVLGLFLPGAILLLSALAGAGYPVLPGPIANRLVGIDQRRLLQIVMLLVLVGFFGPVYWLRGRVAARRRAIEEAFPNILDLLQISVESGLGLDAAMIRVANETAVSAPEISEELLIAQREIQAGRNRDKALLDMAERTGVDAVTSFANVVLQSLRFGSSISDALTTYAREMRVTRELRAQEMANKLPVKMSAIMATLMLPALLMIALTPVVIRYIRLFNG